MDAAASAISDPVRRGVLDALAGGPLAAGDLAARFDISRPAVSRHLRVLRESGLVTGRADGRRRVYALDTAPLRPLAEWIAGARRRERLGAADGRARDRGPADAARPPGGRVSDPTPTGRVVRSGGAYELVVARSFAAPIDDVWASVTEPERTARWFGAWRGEAGPGRTIAMQMGFEEGAPWFDVEIEACEPPRRLAIRSVDDAGEWRMELRLSETAGVTQLELVQHLDDPSVAASTGPGWEYYLDNLVAARAGEPLPDFADYDPAQVAHFEAQARAARLSPTPRPACASAAASARRRR